MTDKTFRTETLSLLMGVFLAIVGGLVYQAKTDAAQNEKLDAIAVQLAEIKADLKALPDNSAQLSNHDVRIGNLEREVYRTRRQ